VASGEVTIRDFEFAPPELTVDAGAQVTFVNAGAAAHTATARDGSFDTGFIAPSGTASLTFATPGTFAFFCALHPEMAGTIRVREPGGASSPPGPPSQVPAPGTAEPTTGGSPPSEGGPAGGAAGDAGPGVDDARGNAAAFNSSPPSRPIGAVLIGVALVGGLVLLIAGTVAAARARRGDALLP
jgi:hypothetical protein